MIELMAVDKNYNGAGGGMASLNHIDREIPTGREIDARLERCRQQAIRFAVVACQLTDLWIIASL